MGLAEVANPRLGSYSALKAKHRPRHTSCIQCGELVFDKTLAKCPKCGGLISHLSDADLQLLGRDPRKRMQMFLSVFQEENGDEFTEAGDSGAKARHAQSGLRKRETVRRRAYGQLDPKRNASHQAGHSSS